MWKKLVYFVKNRKKLTNRTFEPKIASSQMWSEIAQKRNCLIRSKRLLNRMTKCYSKTVVALIPAKKFPMIASKNNPNLDSD